MKYIIIILLILSTGCMRTHHITIQNNLCKTYNSLIETFPSCTDLSKSPMSVQHHFLSFRRKFIEKCEFTTQDINKLCARTLDNIIDPLKRQIDNEEFDREAIKIY